MYGTLAADAPAFTENHPFQPNSPYSASKAASDHLVRAYHHTYGLPVLTSHCCSNNYGPGIFRKAGFRCASTMCWPENPLPIYGDGQQIRDHNEGPRSAIRRVLEAGQPGETHNIGGWNEQANLDVVRTLQAPRWMP